MEVLVTDKDGKTYPRAGQASDHDSGSVSPYRRACLWGVFRGARAQGGVCRSEVVPAGRHRRRVAPDHARAVHRTALRKRRWCTSRGRTGNTAWRSTCSAASSRPCPASGCPRSWTSACSVRSRWWIRVSWCLRRRCPGSREPLVKDGLTGKPSDPMLDMKIQPLNDSGGGGAASTAADYLRFCQMMLDGGKLDGKRYLEPDHRQADGLGPSGHADRDRRFRPARC